MSQFDVVSGNGADRAVNTKGNVTIDVARNGVRQASSVFIENGSTSYQYGDDADNALRINDDSVFNVLSDIVGEDNVLELKDLDNIDKVQKKYNNFQVDKREIQNGQVILKFKNGFNMSIDFETMDEERRNDIQNGYNAPRGVKKEYYRHDLIKNNKDKYDIKEVTHNDLDGNPYKAYAITPKDNVNVEKLKSHLGIADGVISKYNFNYGQWDRGTHISNHDVKKDETIYIPVEQLGFDNDERSYLEQIFSFIGSLM